MIDPASVKFTAASHPTIPAEWIRQAIEESVKSAEAKYGTPAKRTAEPANRKTGSDGRLQELNDQKFRQTRNPPNDEAKRQPLEVTT